MINCSTYYYEKIPETCISEKQEDDTGAELSKSPNLFGNLFLIFLGDIRKA